MGEEKLSSSMGIISIIIFLLILRVWLIKEERVDA